MSQVNTTTSLDRITLVDALSDLSRGRRKPMARSFLEGLSGDELRYIADFFGAKVLDPDLNPGVTRAAAAMCVERFQQGYCGDFAPPCCHKMILLLEFLSLSCLPGTFATRGGRA